MTDHSIEMAIEAETTEAGLAKTAHPPRAIPPLHQPCGVLITAGKQSWSKMLILVLMSAPMIMASGCSGVASNTAGSSFVAGNGDAVIVPQKQRREPVTAAGKTLEGNRLDLATLRGKPVILNVWASWCAPCRKEAPQLGAASKELKTKGIPIIGINTADSVAPARAFERKFKVTYPSLVDEGGLLLAFRGAVSPNAIPTTLVLDAQGRIAARFSGGITTTTLIDLVEDATGMTPIATTSTAK